MKILILATEFPPARGYGLARYTAELSAALVQTGVAVDVVTMNFLQGNPGYIRDGVQVHLLTEQLGFKSFNWVSDTVLNNIPLLERAVSIAQHSRFDLITAHDWLAALAAKAIRTIYRIPLVLTIHDTEVGKRANRLTRDQSYIAETEGWIAKIADRLITTSRFMQNEIAAIYKIPQKSIDIVPCGVNPDRFQTRCNLQDFRRLFAPDDGKIVLFVGRLTMTKGPHVLLEAADTVLKKFPDTTFILAGEGVLRQELSQKAARYPSGRIPFTGHLSGKVLAATYRVADCLAVPSTYEPFGLVALEGMSCNIPVIVSDTGGLSDIVDHERTGLKVPPGNADKLAQAIIRVFESPELARSLAQAAAENSRQEWSWIKAAHRIKTIYQEAVKIPVQL